MEDENDGSGSDSLAAYLRRLCPECLNTLAEWSRVDFDSLLFFVWDEKPLPLDAAGRVSLALLQMKSSKQDDAESGRH